MDYLLYATFEFAIIVVTASFGSSGYMNMGFLLCCLFILIVEAVATTLVLRSIQFPRKSRRMAWEGASELPHLIVGLSVLSLAVPFMGVGIPLLVFCASLVLGNIAGRVPVLCRR